MDSKEKYKIKTIPLVVCVEDKEKHYHFKDNLSTEEIKNISCEPRMLWDFGSDIYFAELPLTYRGSQVSRNLFYIYDELTEEEQEKYKERIFIVETTRPNVVTIYGKKEVVKTKKTNKKTKKRTKNKK